jgi:hypothetical protein
VESEVRVEVLELDEGCPPQAAVRTTTSKSVAVADVLEFISTSNDMQTLTVRGRRHPEVSMSRMVHAIKPSAAT